MLKSLAWCICCKLRYGNGDGDGNSLYAKINGDEDDLETSCGERGRDGDWSSGDGRRLV